MEIDNSAAKKGDSEGWVGLLDPEELQDDQGDNIFDMEEDHEDDTPEEKNLPEPEEEEEQEEEPEGDDTPEDEEAPPDNNEEDKVLFDDKELNITIKDKDHLKNLLSQQKGHIVTIQNENKLYLERIKALEEQNKHIRDSYKVEIPDYDYDPEGHDKAVAEQAKYNSQQPNDEAFLEQVKQVANTYNYNIENSFIQSTGVDPETFTKYVQYAQMHNEGIIQDQFGNLRWTPDGLQKIHEKFQSVIPKEPPVKEAAKKLKQNMEKIAKAPGSTPPARKESAGENLTIEEVLEMYGRNSPQYKKLEREIDEDFGRHFLS